MQNLRDRIFALCSSAEQQPPKAEAPRFEAPFGVSLVALSGPTTRLDFLVHRTELLSPLLATLRPEESLALTFDVDPVADDLVIGVEGIAVGQSADELIERKQTLTNTLGVLIRGQLPGFLFRSFEAAASNYRPQTITRIQPRGRQIASRRMPSAPRPVLVASEKTGVLLPPLSLEAGRLVATLDLIRLCGERARLSLDLRLVRFEAAALRLIQAARDEAVSDKPRTSVEAMRLMAETVPDDALMSALLNDGAGVEVRIFVTSVKPLDAQTRAMVCHAVFGVEPVGHVNDNAVELDLSAVYPRRFALSRAVSMIAGCALVALSRAPVPYDVPALGGCLLGHTRDGRPVEIGERDRARHTYVIGAIGTGKSSLLLNMLRADMEAGKGIILIDPHGDLWEAARRCVPEHRRADVVLAHLGDGVHAFSMNVLQGLGGEAAVERTATVNGLLRLFKNSMWPGVPDAFGPMFEMYFRNALLLLMEARGADATILDFERVFQDDAFRKTLLGAVDTPSMLDFWQKTVERCTHNEISLENIAPYIISKLSPFTSNAVLRPVLGAKESSLDLVDAIARGQIVLVNLSKGIVGEGSARLVGGLIAMRLVAAAQTQMRVPFDARNAFVAYMDEFQSYATEHLAEGIEETRKYKLQLVLANQSLGQIDGRGNRVDVGPSILANVANLVAFRLGVDDAHILARWFAPDFAREDIMYLPDYTAVGRLLVDGQALRPVEFRTCPPLTCHGG